MVRLLRWGTIMVLSLVVIGAAISYPMLRASFFTPLQSAPVATLPGLASIEVARAEEATIAVNTPTPRPTLPAPVTRPAVVIAAPTLTPSDTVTPLPAASQTNVPVASGDSSSDTSIPLATTSLLPDRVTPVVLGPNTDDLATATATTFVTQAELPENSRELADTTVLSGGATAVAPIAPSSSTPTLAPAARITPNIPLQDVTPIVVVPVEVTTNSGASGAAITPAVATSVTVASQVATPLPTPTSAPSGPFANIPSALYVSPDLASPVAAQVVAGQQLIVVGLYTEGNWYLLANGLWIAGDAVSNAPLAMPLVFPTMTPAPSPTPTPTFTPLPTATTPGSPTPTPTATSLDEPVCDCSADNLDCLGNIFANRAEAQRCFEYCFRETGLDIHLLDPNLNGMACENLP